MILNKQGKVKELTVDTVDNVQKYEYIELFHGLAQHLQSRNNLAFSNQEETYVKFILFKGKAGSTFMVRRLREGVSRNGTPWKKWEMWGKVNISCKAQGKSNAKLNVYAMHRLSPGNAQRWQPFQNITPRPDFLHAIIPEVFINDFNNEVERLYTENIGKPLFSAASYSQHYLGFAGSKRSATPFAYVSHLAYPLMRELILNGKKERGIVISGISTALRQQNIMEATKTLYGKTNYRKDLVRAFANASFMTMAITHELRNLIPIDWIIKVMQAWEQRRGLDLNAAERQFLRPFFKVLTLNQRKRLIDSVKDNPHQMWLVSETLRMFGVLTREHEVVFQEGQLIGRSWNELHDFLMSDIQVRGSKEKPIEKVALAKKIEGLQPTEDFSLVLPETTTDLIKWGRDMGHCIGSYTDSAMRGSDVFVGIMHKGNMIGNAQIRTSSKKVVQIFGKRNSILPVSIQQKFSETLISQSVLSAHSFENAFGWNYSVVE